jgi:hypothetical protein
VKTLLFWPHLWFAARWLPVGAKRRSIEQLLSGAVPPSGHTPYRGFEVDRIVTAVRGMTARPWRMRGRRCLREGLLGFRFLRLAGFTPVLHFGVEPGSVQRDKLRAHCWITIAGSCVLNPPTATLVTIFSWDGEKIIKAADALN